MKFDNHFSDILGFSRKNLKPPGEDKNENLQEGRVKVGFPGGMSKFEGKTRIFREVNAK